MKKIIILILLLFFSISSVQACMPYGEYIIGKVEKIDRKNNKIFLSNYINEYITPFGDFFENLERSFDLFWRRKQVYNYNKYEDNFTHFVNYSCKNIKIININKELKDLKKGDFVYLEVGVDSSLDYNYATEVGKLVCKDDKFFLFGKPFLFKERFGEVNIKIQSCKDIEKLFYEDGSFKDIIGKKVFLYYVYKYFKYLIILLFIFIIIRFFKGKK